MLTFHNDIDIKRKYVARTEAHRKADEIIRGTGWNGSKGCAVGCTLEVYDHSRYPIELGIPEWLARVEDTLFEGMSADRATLWPSALLMAVPVGIMEQQLDRRVKAPFLVLVLVLESTLTTFDNEKYPDVTAAVRGSIALWQRDDIGTPAWQDAAATAGAAAGAATRAWSGAAAAAARVAWSAVAAAAARVAWSAVAVAEAEAAEAEAAEAEAAYDKYADELLRLLKNISQ